MHVPVSTLLDTSGGHKCLLYKIFKVRNLCLTLRVSFTLLYFATVIDKLQEFMLLYKFFLP